MSFDYKLLEESAQELLDEAPCGYLTTLPDGTIVRTNRTLLTWLQRAGPSFPVGTTFQQLLTIPGRIYYDTHIGPLLQMQGFAREVAFDLLRPGQSPLPVIVNCVQKRDSEGRPLLHRVTIFDATDRRQYERELLRTRELAKQAAQSEKSAREAAERANRAKDDFLALVSHELRTPLSVILGWAQVLRTKAAGDTTVDRGLSVIERNTRIQARLIDDLLDMGRIVSGKLRLDVQRVDLAQVIDTALETVEAAAAAKNIRVQPVLDPGIVVSGDPGRLQQVFWNLFSNAVKFTPKDGYLRVVMERVNSHIEVRVIDNGQGMSEELLTHVFERFRQSDSPSTRGTPGLGLGLALVKYLVEMHGGSVLARSEGEGRGSTFTVTLPVVVIDETSRATRTHPCANVSVTSTAVAGVSLEALRVLVVDDDADTRELLQNVLMASGADVTSADCASAGLAAIERTRPDVLITDIGMPGEDGYEMLRRVRMLGDGAGRVPAIALTALSRMEDRTRALLAGYQLHLSKPVDARELTIAVASLAGRLTVTSSDG